MNSIADSSLCRFRAVLFFVVTVPACRSVHSNITAANQLLVSKYDGHEPPQPTSLRRTFLQCDTTSFSVGCSPSALISVSTCSECQLLSHSAVLHNSAPAVLQ